MGLVAPAGRVRVDCHLHTVASGDAVLTVEELVERAKQTGLDVVCITDHNVTAAAVQAAERELGVRVVVGEEIRTPNGDVIGLFLTERIPYVLPLAEVIGRIKAQRGVIYVPHPFDPVRSGLGRSFRACAPRERSTSSRFSTPRSETGRSTVRRPTWRERSTCPAARARTRTTRPGWAPPIWRCPTSTARPASSPRWRTRS